MMKTFALSLLAAVACATGSQAAVAYNAVLDNLSTTGNPTGVQPGYTTGTTIGASFVTGTTALTVSEVVFPQIFGTTNTYNAAETFTLYGNNPTTNTPLTAVALGTFALDSNTALNFGAPGFGQTTATANGTMILAPGTRYWLVLSSAAATYWDYLPSAAYYSAYGVSMPTTNTTYQVNGAATTTYGIAAGPQQYMLDANAVPEPSTYALLTVAGAGALVFARRARAATVA